MYTLTGSGTDSHGAQVVIITCSSCGYFEEHFQDPGLAKVGKPCDRCQGHRPGRGVHRPQRPGGHSPGPSQERGRVATLMNAGRWKSSTMPARYTERHAADRGAVARYYQAAKD